jgi:hypothetical protein
MTKFIAATGLAAVLAATIGTQAVAADTAIRSDQMRADKIIGSAVYDRENQDVASVKDLILDRDGKIADVVLSYGSTVGVGGKFIAVAFADLKFSNNRLTLNQTKAQLSSLPAFPLDDESNGRVTASPTH